MALQSAEVYLKVKLPYGVREMLAKIVALCFDTA
jgi:hypothetical protein